MKKGVWAIVLTALLCMVLVACGQSGETPDTPDTPTDTLPALTGVGGDVYDPIIDTSAHTLSFRVAEDVDAFSIAQLRFATTNVTVTLFADEELTRPLEGDVMPLAVGDNVGYVRMAWGEDSLVYRVSIRRDAPAHAHVYGEWQMQSQPTCTENGVRVCRCVTCGDTLTETVEALGHQWSEWQGEMTSCTVGGEQHRGCTRCGAVEERTFAPGDHTWGEWKVTVDPTCTTNGRKLRECTVCHNTEGKTIFMLGHHEVSEEYVAPTCTQMGSVGGSHCDRCGKVLSMSTVLLALGHYVVEDLPVVADCTRSGLTKGSHCDRCKAVLVAQEEVPALGHHEVDDEAIEPTCLSVGYTQGQHCDRCGEVLVAPTVRAALGHDWDEWTVVVQPDCTHTGQQKHQCTRCTVYETERIDALGHDVVIDEGFAPTCEEGGIAAGSHCGRCGEVLAARYFIEPLDHDWQDWVVTTAPTCLDDGVQCRRCARCEIIDTAPVDAVGHTWGEWNETKAPTCTQDGISRRDCAACDVYETGTVPALGHLSVVDEAVSPTCTLTGLAEGSHCGRCDVVLAAQEEVPALGHDWDEWQYTVAPTCTQEGAKWHACLRCEIRQDAVAEALGHDIVVDEALYPTCTLTGLTEGSHCGRCALVMVSQEGVPALGHEWQGWQSVSLPTCTLSGEDKRICERCQAVDKRTVAATGHTWGDWSETQSVTCTQDGISRRDCAACDVYETRSIAATGHDWGEWLTAKAADCTQNGIERRECSACDAYETRDVPAKGHTWGEWGVDTPATCTANGVRRRDCSACDAYQTQVIQATGHAWGEWGVAQAATCTKTGIERRDCGRCDAYETRVLAAAGHTWGEWQVVTEATETQDGLRRHTCTACETTEDQPIYASDHVWGDWSVTQAATCTVAGEETRDCSHCGITQTRAIAATGHSWGDWSVAVAATCTAKGSECRTCAVCKETDTRAIAATGHIWGDWAVTQAATCTADGLQRRDCSECDAYETQTVQATGHMWGEWDVTAATCENDGFKRHDCAECGAYETVVLPATGHDWSDWGVIAEATCTVNGSEYRTCGVCGAKDTRVIAAAGHTWGEWDVTAATCIQDGTKTRTCEVCGAQDSLVLEAKGHTWGDWAVTVQPTCTDDGLRCRTCAVCKAVESVVLDAFGHHVVMDPYVAATCTQSGMTAGYHCEKCGWVQVAQQTLSPMGHDWSDWQVTLAPTCTTTGVQERDCSRCDAHETQKLDALGHDYVSMHYDADCMHYERSWNACSRCGDTTDLIVGDVYGPHVYDAYTCIFCQYDQLNEYAAKFDSDGVVELADAHEFAMLLDYLIFHLFRGTKHVACDKIANAFGNFCSEASKMMTNTNWTFRYGKDNIGYYISICYNSYISVITYDDIGSITPETGQYTATHYTQQEFFVEPKVGTRGDDYSDFPYKQRLHTATVSTSEQLFFAFEHGYRPIPVEGSIAHHLLNMVEQIHRTIINDDDTDDQKVLAIMQWLTRNVEYDYGAIADDNLNNYLATSWYLEGVFDYHLAVCDAFAKAMCVMCGIEDIKCIRVVGDGHAWNRVFIDPDDDGQKSWYVCDSTHTNLGVNKKYEVWAPVHYLMTDAAKTAKGFTGDNYTAATTVADVQVQSFAYQYFSAVYHDAAHDMVIESDIEMRALVTAFSPALNACTTDYFCVVFFVPNTYCSGAAAAVGKLPQTIRQHSIRYFGDAATYNGVSGTIVTVMITP